LKLHFFFFSNERIKTKTCDIVSLFEDEQWMETNKGAHDLCFADIPFGFFPRCHHDILWTPETIAKVCKGAYSVSAEKGTFIVALAGRNHDVWITHLEQAGFTVDRNSICLLEKPSWVKSKAYYQYAPTQCPMHYFLVAHKDPKDYFEAKKPFGTFDTHSLQHTHTSLTQLTSLF
jgi:hypothetical protein